MNNLRSKDLQTLENFITVLECYGVRFDPSKKNQMIACPFHDDHHPSASLVLEGKGWFNCFSCGAGGNLFNFVALQERLNCRKDFPRVLSRTNEICESERRSI